MRRKLVRRPSSEDESLSRPIRLLVFMALSPAAAAQERAGTWELGFIAFDSTSETLSGEGGSSIQVAGGLGLGALGGYNYTNRFALLAELSWSQPDYMATLPIEGSPDAVTIDSDLNLATVLFKGAFYFADSDFTPYIEAGIGWTQIDSNAEDPPSSGCWWDPLSGYICASSFESYSETRFAYSTAFGVRWDFNREALLKVSWGTLRIDEGDRAEELGQDVFRAEFSWKF